MTAELATRDEVRAALKMHMAQTSMSLGDLGEQIGYSRQTMVQFSSLARLGTCRDDGETTQRIARWLAENPAPLAEFPGSRLYETDATRSIDEMIEHAREGGWGTIYGPAGAQKSFFLEWRAAESAHEAQPRLALVEGDTDLSPNALLRRISAALKAPYAQYAEGVRQSILSILRRQRQPVALVIDEAQLLYSRIDTLEALRRLGDQARGKLGVLVCGNEEVLRLFEPRRRVYFEQWRSRIDKREVCVLGPSRSEAERMLTSELAEASARAREVALKWCTVKDPISGSEYVNVRRLFNTIRDYRRKSSRAN